MTAFLPCLVSVGRSFMLDLTLRRHAIRAPPTYRTSLRSRPQWDLSARVNNHGLLADHRAVHIISLVESTPTGTFPRIILGNVVLSGQTHPLFLHRGHLGQDRLRDARERHSREMGHHTTGWETVIGVSAPRAMVFGIRSSAASPQTPSRPVLGRPLRRRLHQPLPLRARPPAPPALLLRGQILMKRSPLSRSASRDVKIPTLKEMKMRRLTRIP